MGEKQAMSITFILVNISLWLPSFAINTTFMIVGGDLGDFVVGAAFPIHLVSDGRAGCSDVMRMDATENVEAAVYSLNRANEDILKDIGIRLGMVVYDTCQSDIIAMHRLREIPKQTMFAGDREESCTCKPFQYGGAGVFVGVIGGYYSAVCIPMANFLRVFTIPQVSYRATSIDLTDSTRFSYFLRTICADEVQVRTIVEIFKALEWRYIKVIHEDTSYGLTGKRELEKLAAAEGICIADAIVIKRFFDTPSEKQQTLEDLVIRINRTANLQGRNVVLLYFSVDIIFDFFRVAKRLLGPDAKKYFWVGCDDMANVHIDPEIRDIAQNTLAVKYSTITVPEFDEYFQKLRPETNTYNPWFPKYWEQTFNCTIGDGSQTSKRKCTSNDVLSYSAGNYERDVNAYLTMDAVYVFAHALKAIHKTKCGGAPGVCESLKRLHPRELLPYMKQVSFKGLSGMDFRFYDNAGPPRYSVAYYGKLGDGQYGWKTVGAYKGDVNVTGKLFFNDTAPWITSLYAPSFCAKLCNPGEGKAVRDPCCWTCVPCTDYQMLPNTEGFCIDCPIAQRANKNKTACILIPETTIDYTKIEAISLVTLSSLGYIVSTLVCVVFIKYRRTPIIMASGKELSAMLMLSIYMLYTIAFAFAGYPTVSSCNALRLLVGTAYTLGYSSMLVKTIRIYRVFGAETKNVKDMRFTNEISQIVIIVIVVSVEVLLLIISMAFDYPKVKYVYPTRGENIRVCSDSIGYSYLFDLIYPICLLCMCVVFAIKTRKAPDGFNETRYINFCSYSFCIVWIPLISVYYSVADNTIRVFALCFASTMNATVILLAMFVPKVYVVMLRPQKNTKSRVMKIRETVKQNPMGIQNLCNMSKIDVSVSPPKKKSDVLTREPTVHRLPVLVHSDVKIPLPTTPLKSKSNITEDLTLGNVNETVERTTSENMFEFEREHDELVTPVENLSELGVIANTAPTEFVEHTPKESLSELGVIANTAPTEFVEHIDEKRDSSDTAENMNKKYHSAVCSSRVLSHASEVYESALEVGLEGQQRGFENSSPYMEDNVLTDIIGIIITSADSVEQINEADTAVVYPDTDESCSDKIKSETELTEDHATTVITADPPPDVHSNDSTDADIVQGTHAALNISDIHVQLIDDHEAIMQTTAQDDCTIQQINSSNLPKDSLIRSLSTGASEERPNVSKDGLIRRLNISASEEGPNLSEDNLISIVDSASEEGPNISEDRLTRSIRSNTYDERPKLTEDRSSESTHVSACGELLADYTVSETVLSTILKALDGNIDESTVTDNRSVSSDTACQQDSHDLSDETVHSDAIDGNDNINLGWKPISTLKGRLIRDSTSTDSIGTTECAPAHQSTQT